MDKTSNSNIADKVVENGIKYFFLHATGLTIPYLGYKVIKALDTTSNTKKATGAAAAVAGIAALIGLTDDVDIS